MGKLQDRVVLVVGAGSISEGWSNGSACAAAYAREGARVICADLFADRAEAIAQRIRSEGGQALALQADATSETSITAAVNAAVESFGRLDVMHNNVGVGGASGAPDRTTFDQWNRELAQNLTSAFLGVRCAAPVLRKRGGGVIINTSSLLAVRFLSKPNVAYSVAKAGVEALTRASAAAYGRDNIRVNCIRIGFSETPLVMLSMHRRGLSAEEQEEAMARSRAKVPLRGEHGDPFDVAAAAVFLASDEARHITGAILNVDGGLECAPV